MASSSAPKIVGYKSDGAIPKGSFVKPGTDGDHVAKCTGASNLIIGIAQNATTGAEGICEVALPGGGGKVLLSDTISAGNRLTSHTDGSGKTASSTELIGAVTLKDGVVGDLVDCEVVLGIF